MKNFDGKYEQKEYYINPTNKCSNERKFAIKRKNAAKF